MPTPFEQEQKSIVSDAIGLGIIALLMLVLWAIIAWETLAGVQIPLLILVTSILGALTVCGNLVHLAARQIDLDTRR